MPDGDPVSRMQMLLAARDLDEAALFALASTHPGIVEQIVEPQYQIAIAYLATLPPPELHRIRQGETIVRSTRQMTSPERRAADTISEQFRMKVKKLQAMRVGPLEGRVYRVEITALGRRKKTLVNSIELAWPSTPERDEDSRNALTQHFGSRPPKATYGGDLPFLDGSFEDDDTLSNAWALQDGVILAGARTPVGEVQIDGDVSIDGSRSLRFHGNSDTRLFLMASQQITVVPGLKFQARAQVQTDNLRVEFQQRPTDVYLGISYLDISGAPVGPKETSTARLMTHTWELLELESTVPQGADFLQIELISAMSGTTWFDGITLELVQ